MRPTLLQRVTHSLDWNCHLAIWPMIPRRRLREVRLVKKARSLYWRANIWRQSMSFWGKCLKALTLWLTSECLQLSTPWKEFRTHRMTCVHLPMIVLESSTCKWAVTRSQDIPKGWDRPLWILSSLSFRKLMKIKESRPSSQKSSSRRDGRLLRPILVKLGSRVRLRSQRWVVVVEPRRVNLVIKRKWVMVLLLMDSKRAPRLATSVALVTLISPRSRWISTIGKSARCWHAVGNAIKSLK